ncbi:MAG: PsbP-related protein [Bacteroidota bacterium]
MKTFFSSIIFLAFISCGQTQTGNKQKLDNWKTYENESFSIQYPPDWELDQSGQVGTSFIIFSPLESEQDGFRENINLIIQDLEGKNIDLTKFASISVEQVNSMVTKVNIIEKKRITEGKDDYYKIIYTGDQGIFHLEYEQYYWVQQSKAFILTFTGEQNKFSKFKKEGESILNSFLIKK